MSVQITIPFIVNVFFCLDLLTLVKILFATFFLALRLSPLICSFFGCMVGGNSSNDGNSGNDGNYGNDEDDDNNDNYLGWVMIIINN